MSWALAGHTVHQDDWYVAGADGGSPIKAVRSRISELERDWGYGFHHTRRPDGTVEYRLAYVPEPAPVRPLVDDGCDAVRSTDEPPAGERLFEPAAAAAPAALNATLRDWENDAA